MAKLLGIISLILAIVLFPPAALAVISNNAVPGDAAYPIKRFLEDGIYAVASLTPTTKAWFAAARSDRRFQEVAALITQGKQAGDTLNELVEQTQIAASQINQITDQKQKEQLINQLSQSIEKYDQGLQQLTVQPSIPPAVPQPAIAPSPTPSPSVTPTISSPTPRATPTAIIPPTAPTPLPTVQPVPGPNREGEGREGQRQREIEEARRRLEEIKRRLEEESSRHQINQTQSREERSGRSENRDKEEKSENRKDNKRKD